jgi:protein-tyrosine kinase
MSKFFDGLKKTDGAIAKLTIEAIGTELPPSPKPAGNGAAAEAHREPQALHTSLDVTEQPAAARLPYEDAVEGIRTLSDRSNWEDVAHPVESPSDSPLRLHETDLSGIVRTTGRHPADPTIEPLPDSPEEPAPSEGDSKSVVIRLRAGSPLLPFDTGEADVAAEEYRRIRTKILQHPMGPHLVLVSSPAPGDGKSITSLNLGGALALNRDARVLLVDVDLRHPTIATLLGIPERNGVAEVLSGACTLEDAMVRLEPFPNLFLLPAGKDRRNPVELLSSPRWKELCEEFRSQMTYVVLDGPPVEAVAEYSLLLEFSDGLILVVRKGHTIRSLLYRAVEATPKDKLVGTVINDYRESFFWKQRNDYYY